MKLRARSRRVMQLRAWVPARHRCPECGKRGHWISAPAMLGHILSGFWTCAKFYGPDGRRRLS